VSVRLSVSHVSTCICPSVCLSCVHLCLSVCLSLMCPLVSVRLSVSHVSTSVCPSVCLSCVRRLCLSVCLSLMCPPLVSVRLSVSQKVVDKSSRHLYVRKQKDDRCHHRHHHQYSTQVTQTYQMTQLS